MEGGYKGLGGWEVPGGAWPTVLPARRYVQGEKLRCALVCVCVRVGLSAVGASACSQTLKGTHTLAQTHRHVSVGVCV